MALSQEAWVRMAAADHAVYLGFPMGPGAGANMCTEPMGKFGLRVFKVAKAGAEYKPRPEGEAAKRLPYKPVVNHGKVRTLGYIL